MEDVSRDILYSKSRFLNKIRVSETLNTYLTGCRVVYWAFVDLSHCKMALWFCWPFYTELSINCINVILGSKLTVLSNMVRIPGKVPDIKYQRNNFANVKCLIAMK